jgi:hypothetical protein
MEYITKDHQGCQSERPCYKKQKWTCKNKKPLSNTKVALLIPKHQWPNWAQNCLKATPLECKADYAKLGPSLVFLTIRSCSQHVYLYVCQILNTHSLPFIRSKCSKLEKKWFFFVPKGYASDTGTPKMQSQIDNFIILKLW